MSLPPTPPRRPRYDPNGATRPVLPQNPPPRPPMQPPQPLAPPPALPKYPAYPPAAGPYPPLRDQRRKQRSQQNLRLGCGLLLGLVVIVGLCLGSLAVLALFVAPVQGNLLVIGIDRVPAGTLAGRSDTNVLVHVDSGAPRIATLAVPRDLWVKIPNYGENRINTAHFFAEAAQPGSGPAAAMQTFSSNFGIPITYYLRVRLEGVPGLIDAMGGITLDLAEPMAGYTAGKHHLDGTAALAFVRDRKNTDDFFRMEHGQIFIKAAAQQALNPLTWLRLPLIYAAFQQTVDSNLSIWQLANLAATAARLGPAKIESHVLPREATTPTTINGAQVLLPRWDRIRPLVDQVFK